MFLSYVARRAGMLLVVVFMAISVNFIIPRLTPGDPIAARLAALAEGGGGSSVDFRQIEESYRKEFGLDQPVWRQYLSYWRNLSEFSLGYSITNYPQTVSQLLSAALPWTLGLVGVSTILSFLLGSLLGALLAWPSTTWQVKGLTVPLMVISSVPYFLLGIVLIFLFAIRLHWFPAAGGYSFGTFIGANWQSMADILKHAILPSLSVVMAGVGTWALGMRGSMVGTLGEDFITMAEAKGLAPSRIFFSYGVRNSLLPQLTQLSLQLGYVVAGVVLVEVIFSYPGIGYQLYQAVLSKDYFVIQGIVLVLILTVALMTFIMDLIYPLIDPRITFQKR
jgi:peptide/nickel transport system permease protein